MIDACIVGAQKAGTSTLYNWLAQHEDIFAPQEFKDFPLFSASKDNYSVALRRARKVYCSRKSTDNALRLSADANLICHPNALKRLKDYNRCARLIFLMREPAARCFSAWRYARERNLEKRSFSEAIEQELSGAVLPMDSYEGRQMNYVFHSRYSDQLKVIGELFPPEQVLLLPFDRMLEAPVDLMDECTDFLGIHRKAAWRFDVINRTSAGSRSKLLSKMLYSEKNNVAFRLARNLMPWHMRASIRRQFVIWNRSAADSGISQRIDAATARKIRQALPEETLLYSKLLESTAKIEAL